MIIHRLLDELFRSWSHVAVIRALLDTSIGFTGNEVARISGMHPRSALKALTRLEELGIVNRQRGGRDHIFTLNRSHSFVKDAILPLYRVESEFPDLIINQIKGLLKKYVTGAIVFGSVAKRDETPRSDFDLCCIVRNNKKKDIALELINNKATDLYRNFGIRISPIFFTEKEFRKASNNPLIREINEQGIVILGRKP